MTLSKAQKELLKKEVATCLATEPEVRKAVVFGSFLDSDDPHDLDIAVFQESDEAYLPLALKYRRKLARIADRIPLDVIPVRPHPVAGHFLRAIERGEVIYERRGSPVAGLCQGKSGDCPDRVGAGPVQCMSAECPAGCRKSA